MLSWACLSGCGLCPGTAWQASDGGSWGRGAGEHLGWGPASVHKEHGTVTSSDTASSLQTSGSKGPVRSLGAKILLKPGEQGHVFPAQPPPHSILGHTAGTMPEPHFIPGCDTGQWMPGLGNPLPPMRACPGLPWNTAQPGKAGRGLGPPGDLQTPPPPACPIQGEPWSPACLDRKEIGEK